MSGIYLHIPFCKQACSYCDFYFVTRHQQKEEFIKAIIREVEEKKDSIYISEPIETIYFGGGTPSLLSKKELSDILEAIYATFNVEAQEITLELNPDDVTAQYLKDIRSIGVNRVSMGVQSFNEDLLRFMNRAHSAEEALRCLELLQSSGIDVFTVDLIYGNPRQSVAMLEKDLDTLLSFNPPHVSAYSLTIEPRTRLGKQLELGRLIPAEDDQVELHFDLVEQKLAEKGIERYEVSNFSQKGKEAIHNTNYWSHKNYLGLGPGAHSFWWNEEKTGAFRWENKPNLENYLTRKNSTEINKEYLNLDSLAEERIMLGLRTMKGIDLKAFELKYNFTFNNAQKEYLLKMQSEGKLIVGTTLNLTSKGLKIADAIVLDLISLA